MNRGLGELRELTRLRLFQFLREPEAIFWVFLFPLALALVLGLAFKNRGVEVANIGFVEGSLQSAWIEALDQHEGDVVLVKFESLEEAQRKLRSGGVAALIEGEDTLVLHYDPSRPEAELAKLRVEDLVQEAAGREDVVELRHEHVTEAGSRYIDFLIPGLLGMNLMGTGIWGTGFAIVDMRQKKLLKLFLVTPLRRPNFLLAQILSRLVFLAAEVLLIVLFGVFVLGVPFRGPLLAFALVCGLGGMCFSGLGLLVASRAQTLEGVSGIMNFVMMPMWLMSGVFFSYEKFPEFLHPFIRLLPLTALNDSLRAIMLEGEGLLSLAGPTAVQAVWTVGAFVLALKWFRWR